MNREQRRAYARRIKNDPLASVCPECGAKARFFTRARGEKDTVVKCEVCGNIVREGEEVTKLVPPGIYIPMPLAAFDMALLAEAAKVEVEEEKLAVDEEEPSTESNNEV